VLITLKNTDCTRFFVIKPRHTSRLKNRSGWVKPSVGALVTCGKRLLLQLEVSIWTFTTVFLLRKKRPRIQQSASKFRNLPLQAKDRTNCAVGLSVSGTSRSFIRPWWHA